MAQHPVIDPEAIQTAGVALATFIKKKLPLLSSDVYPSDFQKEAERTYEFIINGGTLEGNKRPGPDESKIIMHIKSGSQASKAITEAIESMEKASQTEANDTSSPVEETIQLSSDPFFAACEDIFHIYLDSVDGSSVPGDDHSIFRKLTKLYEDRFMEDMRNLNVLDPDEMTRVTEYGPEIVNFVEKIIDNKFAYPTPDGSVYFNIQAFEDAGNHYARLEPWNRNDKHLQNDGEGALTKNSSAKLSKNDFALWKSSHPGEPSWPSPWGKGRPGWHIECSAMASAKLGKQMDIHSGGIDLAFPHHDNELAQSEAYWDGTQWVNYFIHMGHLSIQGSKMSKSLKNFTTIREALEKGTWNSRSLRIVFLLGGWREGIEITDDMVKASNAWEEKLNNFFLKAKNLPLPDERLAEEQRRGIDDSLTKFLKLAEDKVFEALCDSFDTPGAMSAISELVTSFNSTEVSTMNITIVESAAKWITKMVNIFGLNGTASPDNPDLGWSGIDIPEYAKPYLYPLSAARDTLRQLAISKRLITPETLKDIFNTKESEQPASDIAQPYADVLSSFKDSVSSVTSDPSENSSKELLTLCDRIRDVDLFDLGIYLEDRENSPALVRPVTKDLIEARRRQSEQSLLKQRQKEEREQKALDKAEKGKLSHLEMFKTEEFSAWDDDGVPTRDSAGNEITKSRGKKLRKDWERQKKLHEAWVKSNSG